jgi:hypothetical protein
VLNGLTCIERRVDVNALDLSSKLLFECFEGKEVVAEDEAVVEEVVVGNALLGVVAWAAGPCRSR